MTLLHSLSSALSKSAKPGKHSNGFEVPFSFGSASISLGTRFHPFFDHLSWLYCSRFIITYKVHKF